MKQNRRDFLLTSGGILVASRASVFGQKKKRVIVAGAGLAGLSAAFELSRKGFDVTVIEGRDRIGGRVFTLRETFSKGLHVETGGELLGDGYKRMLGYADKFGIKYEKINSNTGTGGSVADLQPGGIGRTAHMRGKLYPRGTVIKEHPYGLKGAEGKVLPPTLYGLKLRQLIGQIRQKKKTLADFDKLSLADALRENGTSEKAIELMNISLNYNSIETVSTGGILFDGGKRRGAGTVPVRIIGGNDLLPKALAENSRRNGVKFILSAKVKKVSQNKKGIKVSFQNTDGKTQTIKGEKLVCTIPFSVLKEIEFSPPLPEQKSKAINELDYTQNTKVYLQGETAEWDRRKLGSSIWTDTHLERIFLASRQKKGQKGVFTIWTEGEGSKVLEKMRPLKRMDHVWKKFAQMLPFMRDKIEKADTISWSQDEFVRGAYAHLKVGQLMSIHPHIKTTVGNIHFAGEHTAEKSPGMEGALESAERVVKEVLGVKGV